MKYTTTSVSWAIWLLGIIYLAICLSSADGTGKTKNRVPTLGWFWLQGELCWKGFWLSAKVLRLIGNDCQGRDITNLPIDLSSKDEGASVWHLLTGRGAHTYIRLGRTLHFTVCKSGVPTLRLCSHWWQHYCLVFFPSCCYVEWDKEGLTLSRLPSPETHQLWWLRKLPWLPQMLWSNGHLSS